MKKFILFTKTLIEKINENDIMPLASELTYRMIFSLFPFIIFLIALVGYLNIDSDFLLAEVFAAFPLQIAQVIDGVISETVDTRSPTTLSASLLVSLLSVTTGFRAIMRGINKVYGQTDNRSAAIRWLYSAVLVLALAVGIISSLIVIIYGDMVYSLITRHFSASPVFSLIFGLAGILATMTIMLATIILIYRLSSCQKIKVISLIPGAMLTLVVWAGASKLFNFYINNFSSHSRIYGSIASIILTMLWLNIVSATILIGAQTNAILNVNNSAAIK